MPVMKTARLVLILSWGLLPDFKDPKCVTLSPNA